MPATRHAVDVWASWDDLGAPARVGVLHSIPARGKEVFSFEYEQSWLDAGYSQTLDPTLRLLRGPQYLSDDRLSFGLFLDSSPDRWGRLLLKRREAQLAREAHRAERTLTELDYLLGVYDGHRLGGLRFRIDDGPFLDDNTELASAPWASLRDLEHASLQLERGDAERDPAFSKWLKMLIAPGRSLGGSRPKASVVDTRGALWIAKFPSTLDEHDVGAWESVAHALADRAGVRTAEARRQKFSGRHHTFLSRRFDRSPAGGRIHFASAMTLLERADGDEGASYLDLAKVIIQHGAAATEDLEQLWRRIVFFVAISNVDDHLRNHGFLLTPTGWSLAPAYDVNPVATGGGLALNISESDNAQDLALVRDVAVHFRVKPQRANEIINEVIEAVSTWRAEAKKAKIAKAEQDRMAPAFRAAGAG